MPETVRVVAPATLSEGFSFEATVHGKTFVVVVPEGGMKEGQEFEVPYPSEGPDDCDNDGDDDEDDDNDEASYDDPSGIPHGKWRTELCSCCDVMTQATFWMPFFCFPVFVAQILTRLKLGWRGREGPPEEASMTFNRVVVTWIIILQLGTIPVVGFGFSLVYMIYMMAIGALARNYMRRKFDIPPGLCGMFGDVADDCCCMVFCTCCTTIQMARHTHDDKEFPGYCCTTNGLEPDAPELV